MTKKAQDLLDKIAEHERYMGSRAYDTAANIGTAGTAGWMQNRALMGRAATGKGLVTSEEKKIAPKIKSLAGEKTYPISRALTNPVVAGVGEGVMVGGQVGAHTKNPLAMAAGVVAGSAYGVGANLLYRKAHGRALLGRAEDKKEGVGYQEKKILEKLKK